jgi:hypothetical protein
MAASTKADLINGAYSFLRINGLTVGPSGFDLGTALVRLESLASMLCARNICTSYNFTENPDLNDLTNVPQEFNLMFETNLAVWLCPDFGKEVPATLAALASSALATASAVSGVARMQDVRYPYRMPMGSGNTLKSWRYNNFYYVPPAPPASCTTHDMYMGDINEFSESYVEYLRSGETIQSYVITADPGLTLLSDSDNGTVITYEVQAINQQTSGQWQQVKIVVTTTDGRVQTRLINFNVIQSNTVGSP